MIPSHIGRNALQWSAGDQLFVMTTDNSGAIGEKEADEVHVPYPVVSYYAFRSAVLDCLSAGALPTSIVIHNFCGQEAWVSLLEGVQKGLNEIGFPEVAVSGSTESNMSLIQSALAITVIGERKREFTFNSDDQLEWSIDGAPLVGMEVVNQADQVAPLAKARKRFEDEDILLLWPVGSKGISEEWRSVSKRFNLPVTPPPFKQDLYKSAGPSTCWIIGKRVQVKTKASEQ